MRQLSLYDRWSVVQYLGMVRFCVPCSGKQKFTPITHTEAGDMSELRSCLFCSRWLQNSTNNPLQGAIDQYSYGGHYRDQVLFEMSSRCVQKEQIVWYRVELERCVFCLHCLSEMEASHGRRALQCPIHQWVGVSYWHFKLQAKKQSTCSGKRPRDEDDNEESKHGAHTHTQHDDDAASFHPLLLT
jgi:hypothetical protein